jgi:hypothetical protein
MGRPVKVLRARAWTEAQEWATRTLSLVFLTVYGAEVAPRARASIRRQRYKG